MADSESDEDNDWKKGEKRRQDSCNEDSDEDSYSEDDADTSDESFDENMEIPVEFEAFPPTEEDFSGIRCLLQQLFQKSAVNLSKLCDLIISQPEVSTVIKVVNDEDQESNGESKDHDEETHESEEDVYGVTTVVNLKKHQDNDAVRELKKFLLDNCKESGSKETREEFTEVMEGQHAIGFLINERFINIPPQIAAPVYKTLRSELKKVHKKGQDTPLSYFIILCKTYKEIETKTNKKGKKAKKPKVQETTKSLDFINVEDEVFLKASQLSFSFEASTSSDETLVGGKWTSDDSELKPYRTVLVLSTDKFDEALEGIRTMLTQ